MLATGLMIRDDATATIHFAEPPCSGAGAVAAMVASYGLTMATADAMADDLMTRRLARVEGERLVLEGCEGRQLRIGRCLTRSMRSGGRVQPAP